jgi:hypothetical protein
MSAAPAAYPPLVQQQRREAERLDPFPANDIAPVVEGARPREFTNPASTVQRAREAADARTRFMPVGTRP